jgi:hypothetical protein
MSFYNYDDGVCFADMTNEELVKLGFFNEEDDQPVVLDREAKQAELALAKARALTNSLVKVEALEKANELVDLLALMIDDKESDNTLVIEELEEISNF